MPARDAARLYDDDIDAVLDPLVTYVVGRAIAALLSASGGVGALRISRQTELATLLVSLPLYFARRGDTNDASWSASGRAWRSVLGSCSPLW